MDGWVVPDDTSDCQGAFTRWHSATFQTTWIFSNTAVRTHLQLRDVYIHSMSVPVIITAWNLLEILCFILYPTGFLIPLVIVLKIGFVSCEDAITGLVTAWAGTLFSYCWPSFVREKPLQVCLYIRHIMKPSLNLCLYFLLYNCRIQFYGGMKCVLWNAGLDWTDVQRGLCLKHDYRGNCLSLKTVFSLWAF